RRWVPDHGRGARRDPLGRPAPAAGAGARLPDRSPHSHPGRLDQLDRQRHRGRDPASHLPRRPRPDDAHHHPPPVADPLGRSDPGPASGPSGGHRIAHGVDAHGAGVPAHLRAVWRRAGMSFFAGLDAESYDRTYGDARLASRMWSYFKPHARKLVWVRLAILAMSVAGAAGPLLISAGGQGMAEGQVTPATFSLALALFLMGVIIWGANWVRRRLSAEAVGDVMLALRADAFRAAIGHDMAFFSEHASGRVVSRITSDTQEFAQVVVLLTDLISQGLEAMILLAR